MFVLSMMTFCKSDLFASEFIDLIVTSPPYNVGIDYDSNDDTLSYQDYLDFSRTMDTELLQMESTARPHASEHSAR